MGTLSLLSLSLYSGIVHNVLTHPSLADLSSLFTWNTKQVFAYIKATYPSKDPSAPPTEAIIWDAILPSKLEPWHQNQYIHPTAAPKGAHRTSAKIYSAKHTPGALRLRNQKPKYLVTDPRGKLATQDNVTLSLEWNVQPWVGALVWPMDRDWGVWKRLRGGRTEPFTFPQVSQKKGVAGTAKGSEGNRGKPA